MSFVRKASMTSGRRFSTCFLAQTAVVLGVGEMTVGMPLAGFAVDAGLVAVDNIFVGVDGIDVGVRVGDRVEVGAGRDSGGDGVEFGKDGMGEGNGNSVGTFCMTGI